MHHNTYHSLNIHIYEYFIGQKILCFWFSVLSVSYGIRVEKACWEKSLRGVSNEGCSLSEHDCRTSTLNKSGNKIPSFSRSTVLIFECVMFTYDLHARHFGIREKEGQLTCNLIMGFNKPAELLSVFVQRVFTFLSHVQANET